MTAPRRTRPDQLWSWVLKLTGWGTFVIGGVVVPLVQFGRVDYGTLAIGTLLALGGSADRLMDMFGRSRGDDGKSST